jgi:hypothetical protein
MLCDVFLINICIAYKEEKLSREIYHTVKDE